MLSSHVISSMRVPMCVLYSPDEHVYILLQNNHDLYAFTSDLQGYDHTHSCHVCSGCQNSHKSYLQIFFVYFFSEIS